MAIIENILIIFTKLSFGLLILPKKVSLEENIRRDIPYYKYSRLNTECMRRENNFAQVISVFHVFSL